MTRPSDVDCRAVSPWPAERRRRLTTGTEKRKNPGDDLFSRKAALSVSSALESLTSVFGMGTGVASPLESPGFSAYWMWFGSGPARDITARARGAKFEIYDLVVLSDIPSSH